MTRFSSLFLILFLLPSIPAAQTMTLPEDDSASHERPPTDTSFPLKVFKRVFEYSFDVPRSYCIDLDRATKICQRLTETKSLMTFERDNKALLEWDDDAIGSVWEAKFEVLKGDIDDDRKDELVVAELQAQGNGFGIETWRISIIDNPESAHPPPPLHFEVNVYGSRGVFLRHGASPQCQILKAEWASLKHPRKGWGMYLVGRWYHYRKGELVPVSNRPVLIRRYLNSFAKERERSWNDPNIPLKWLQNKNVEIVNAGFLKQYGENQR